jgi:hypothetical protein
VGFEEGTKFGDLRLGEFSFWDRDEDLIALLEQNEGLVAFRKFDVGLPVGSSIRVR